MPALTKLACLVLPLAGVLSAGTLSPARLTTTAAVHRLSPAQASTAIPVHLHGVVTALSGWKNSFFLQDSSGGISIDRLDDSPLQSGDLVDVDGVTDPGGFAPVVISHRVTTLGKGELPRVRDYSWDQLSQGALDSQWISIRGVVSDTHVATVWDRPTLVLDVQTPNGLVQGYVHDFSPSVDYTGLVDSRVRIQGVCGSQFNERRQFIGLRIFIPNLPLIHVERFAPPDPFDIPITSLSQIMQFGSIATRGGDRIRVEATVTFTGRDNIFYLQDGNFGIRVRATKPSNLPLGARVEAAGFLLSNGYSPSLDNAILRQISKSAPIVPVAVDAAGMIRSRDGFTYALFSGQLVRIEATLLDSNPSAVRQLLVLKSGNFSFEAELDPGEKRQLAAGSLLQLTGICEIESGADRVPRSFHLLLRSPADIQVKRVPLWTVFTATWLAALLLLGLLGASAWLVLRSVHRNSRLKALGFLPMSSHLGAGHALVARALAVAASLIGLVYFVAALGNFRLLTNFLPNCAPMAPNVALVVFLLGLALVLDRNGATPLWARFIAYSGVAVAIFVGAFSVYEFIFNVSLPFDRFFLSPAAIASPISGDHPGRVAAAAAVNILLLSFGILFRHLRRHSALAQFLILLAAANCLLQGLRFVYGWNSLGYFSRTAMAAPAVFAFSVLCASAFLFRPGEGIMLTVLSPAPGGILARRLLPASVLIPVVLGWFRWQGELKGYYSTIVGLILFTAAVIVTFAFLIILTAVVLNRMDLVRSAVESELKDSENRLVHLANAMHHIVWTTNPLGQEEYYNRFWFEYSGRDESHPQFHEGIRSTVHRDDLHEYDRLWRVGISTGEPFSGELRLRNAAAFYRWHLKRLVPVKQDGCVVRWIGTCTDIEDYKQAQDALLTMNFDLEARVKDRTAELQRTYARLQGIMDATTQVAIILFSENRIIRMFNKGAEKMLHYSADELVGSANIDCLFESGTAVSQLAALAQSHSAELEEWNLARKDGSLVPVAFAVTTVRGPSGEVIGFLGVATDISALKAMEIALRRNNQQLADQTARAETANRTKDQFLATMSHEIRTPMNAVLGITDILSETVLDSQQRNYLEVSRRAGAALMSLINDMLDLAKIEAGQLELERIEFQLDDVLNEAMELVAPKARARKLTLALRAAPELPTLLLGDPARLRQILLNLMGNAVKFTEKGEVILSVSPVPSTTGAIVEFSVSDTGIGIPANKLETIFEDFKQADASTTRVYGGTGLGLGISRRLVQRMGGRLCVESQPGIGSTFRFSIHLDIPDNPTPFSPVGDQLRGATALVLDPNSTTRSILVALLASWGVHSDEFSRPSEAIMRLQENYSDAADFQLIILDSHLEDSTGLEIVRNIRPLVPAIPIVMLTSTANHLDAARRAEVGLTAHALTPIRKPDLFRLLCEATGRAALRAAPSATTTPLPNQIPICPLRILVAEDLPDNQFLVRAYLQGSPHQLTFVEDGQQAVSSFRQGNFDLVLMDMLMPIMDGLDATRAIRLYEHSEGLTPVPILALSANATAADIQRSLDAGCHGHVSKPVTKARLLSAIQEFSPGVPRISTPEIEEDDPFLREKIQQMLPAYLTDRQRDAAAISALLDNQDFPAIRVIGHNMKGTGKAFGLPEISRLGAALQSAAEKREIETTQQATSDLVAFMRRLSGSTPQKLRT